MLYVKKCNLLCRKTLQRAADMHHFQEQHVSVTTVCAVWRIISQNFWLCDTILKVLFNKPLK